MAIKIKIVSLDGSDISKKQVILRNIVSWVISFSLVVTVSIGVLNIADDIYPLKVYPFLSVENDFYYEELSRVDPYSNVIVGIMTLWLIFEVITLVFTKKKRAIHDFIAGTVVINLKKSNLELDDVNSDV